MFFDDPEEFTDEEYESFLEEISDETVQEETSSSQDSEIADFCNCKNPSIKEVFISSSIGKIKVCRKCKKEVDDLPF